MDSSELIELFYNRTYEKFVNKQILDDKNFIVPRQQLINYVHELIDIPYIEFLDYIKNDNNDIIIEANDITQFSSFSACEIDMCNALIWVNNPGCQFVDVGRLFPDNVSSRTDAAYRKYGENHVKTASQLGLTFEYYEYWYLSCIGYIYPDLEEDVRKQLLARTITRNSLYRHMLIDIIDHDVNLEVYMNMLSENTMKRRMGNVYSLFDICLEECKYCGIVTHRLIRKSANIDTSIPTHTPKDNFTSYGSSYESSYNKKYDSLIQTLGAYEFLSTDDEITLFQRYYLNRDQKTRDRLANSYLRLVVTVAKQYKNNGIDFDDLIQEGTIGLMDAIEHFDYTRGIPFSKYAPFWIRHSILQAIYSLPYHVKIPAHQINLYKKVRKEIENFERKNEYSPSVSEIDIDEDVNIDNLSYLSNLPDNLSNLTSTRDDWEDYPNYDFIPDDGLEKEDKINIINTALYGLLGEREIEIVKAVWGVDQEEQSLSKIAERFYLTRERVRQIAWKAVSKIKDSSIYKRFLYTDGKLLGKQIEDEKDDKVQNTNIQEGTLLLSEVNNEFHNVGKKQRLEVNSSRKWDRDLYKLPPQKKEKKESQEENASSGKSLDSKRKDGVQETKSLNVSDESTEKSIFTPDIIYSVFKNTTSTYKFYWFISILQLLQKTKESHLYIYDVLARMVANAWCPLICYNIYFGSNDSLRQIVFALQKATNLPNYVILDSVYDEIHLKKDNELIKNQLQRLIKYVPYRFLSPWLKTSDSDECIALSKELNNNCLYALLMEIDNPFIIINPSWERYLRENYDELINFSFNELSRFLQDKNPSITDIREKIDVRTYNESLSVFNVTYNSYAIDNISIKNVGRSCLLCDENGETLFSSTGKIVRLDSSFYRLIYTYSFFSANIIVKSGNGTFHIGDRIIYAQYQSKLYNKFKKDIYHEQIEGIRHDNDNNCYLIEVGNKWYNNSGDCVDSDEPKNITESRKGRPWTKEEEELVTRYFQQGIDTSAIAVNFGRTEVAIKMRLAKFGLIDYTYSKDEFLNNEIKQKPKLKRKIKEANHKEVRTGDWIITRGNRDMCQVVKIEEFGPSEKLFLRFRDGRMDWIINNPDIYDIVD